MSNALNLDIPAGVPWIDFTREFDAPVEALWNAHRDPDLVRQWLGPRGYEMDIERWDFTTGGGYRYTHRDGDNVYGFHGTFHTIRDNDLAIQTFEFEGAPDEVAIEFMRFVDLGDGRSRLEGRSIGRTVEGRDMMVESGMEKGMAEGYERLDELVAQPATLRGGPGLTMDWTLEVVIVPVSDLDDAIAFYRDRVGFDLDHDTRTEQMHVAQLTPRGSGCSIVVGDLPTQRAMTPGSLHGLQLVVADAAAARAELVGRGVECSEVTVFDERDGGTFFGFSDPDGNSWAVQQIAARADRPLIPAEARGRFGEGVEL